MSSIEYRGVCYPVREVYVPEIGLAMVSTKLLASRIIGDDGSPVTKEAERIDDGIFFYVEDSMMKSSDEELAKHIKENL